VTEYNSALEKVEWLRKCTTGRGEYATDSQGERIQLNLLKQLKAIPNVVVNFFLLFYSEKHSSEPAASLGWWG
jgi:hypothetical protein